MISWCRNTASIAYCAAFLAVKATNPCSCHMKCLWTWLSGNSNTVAGLELEREERETQINKHKHTQGNNYNMQTLLAWQACRLQAVQGCIGDCVTLHFTRWRWQASVMVWLVITTTTIMHSWFRDDSCRVFLELYHRVSALNLYTAKQLQVSKSVGLILGV